MNNKNRARLSKLALGLAIALATAPVFAQGTSAGLGGQVLGLDGKPVAGAEITITHDESGTVSRAITDENGRYSARGLRVGGPYTVIVTKDGAASTEKNIYLDLSRSNTVDSRIGQVATELDTVTATVGMDVFSANNMGAGTTVDRITIDALPSAAGNIQDYMRLDPRIAFVDRASGSISAGGQNPRYNNVRIDGVSSSDTFGLEGNNLAVRRQPVAMEAVEAINIDLSSYDVAITGATGAVVDAVTKSGTNQFHGSIYGTYRSGDWFGDDPLDQAFNGFTKETDYGFTLGGPLIKDRLYFFVNYDKFVQAAPGANLSASPLGKTPQTITQTDIDRATQIAAGYGFDAGGLDSTGDMNLEEYALKLDWNISEAHRASFRYSNLEQSKLRINGVNSSQLGLSSYWYQQPKTIKSYVGQLFSDWSGNFSTELKVSYRDYAAIRDIPTTAPSVRIYFGGTPSAPRGDSLFLGTEVNSQANQLYTKTWTTNAAGIYTVGDHDVKFGVDWSSNEIYNLYGPFLFGVYEFANMDKFAAGEWYRYTLRTPQPGRDFDSLAAEYTYDSLGLYLQDEWYVNDQLTVTYGVRADKPSVDHKPEYNALAQQVYGYDNSDVINSNFIWQPRVGFNYQFNGDRQMQLRGGFGLFQGDSPQVWLANSYNTTGFNYLNYSPSTYNPDLKFNGDGYNQPVPALGTQTQNVSFVAPDLEQPSVWKANLAFETETGWMGTVFSAEALISKVNTALYYQQLSVGAPTLTGPDGRQLYYNPSLVGKAWNTSSNNVRYNRDKRFDQVFLIDTTDKGGTEQYTVSLEKPWSATSDWSWVAAYTYTNATEVSGLTSSTVTSGWNYTYRFDANENVASRSRYEIRDRFSGNLTWKHDFFEGYRTQIGVVYEGRSGRPYSYVFNGDFNGDGRTNNDLFYVPSGPGDVLFGTLSSGGVFVENQAMQAAFFTWLGNEDDLGKWAGKTTKGNAGRAGFINTFDVRISQEFPGFFSGNKAEIWLDLLNFGNMLNHNWGQVMDYGFFANQRIASVQGIYDGKYVYNFTSPDAPAPANSDADGFNVGVSQWSVQVGVRYEF